MRGVLPPDVIGLTISPSTEEVLAEVTEATAADVDRAVQAARRADRKSTRLNSSHPSKSRMPSSA